jgi:pimeloyl-ACP methyl ester carboxylesterase
VRAAGAYSASDGARLAFTDGGPRESRPLLFLHGWQADARIWGPLIAALGAHLRVVTVDLRGAGGSAEAPGPYTLERFAADLTDLVAALDLGPAVVVGHSMGAAVAQRFAIDRPDAVEGLVLIAAVPASGVPFSPKVLEFFRSTAGNPEQTARWQKSLTVHELPSERQGLIRDAAAMIRAEVALESLASWQGANFAGEAATIETPTLILAPSADRPMTPEFLKAKVADLIAGSIFEIINDCGHYAPLEQPERLAARIERFVEEL